LVIFRQYRRKLCTSKLRLKYTLIDKPTLRIEGAEIIAGSR
jgi:hypothetical protein